eukprot:TRINITY_DN20285_c0_g1_i1.p1 TRINITY_DN20285_c0_g1~~TRINITY_DN20285_c0_g1_i1.p1  ORF type:complete len:1423 (-),score=317.21 TRINITY_DN20285_c0_g1_i1:250-4518(-)
MSQLAALKKVLVERSPRSSESAAEKNQDVLRDNDLARALGEIPAATLATIDEAFVVLDNGLAAAFNASMAREKDSGVSRSKKPRHSSFSAARGELIGDGRKSLTGVSLLKSGVNRMQASSRMHTAQLTTMNMMMGFMMRRDSRDKLEPLSPLSRHAAVSFEEEEEVGPEYHLVEDPELRSWAEQRLALPPVMLEGLEGSARFRGKLRHQMLCWQALHMNKIHLPNAAEPALILEDDDLEESDIMDMESWQLSLESLGLASELPSTASTRAPAQALVFAGRSLFGLTHHQDAQRSRRSVPQKLRQAVHAGAFAESALAMDLLPDIHLKTPRAAAGQGRAASKGQSGTEPPTPNQSQSARATEAASRVAEKLTRRVSVEKNPLSSPRCASVCSSVPRNRMSTEGLEKAGQQQQQQQERPCTEEGTEGQAELAHMAKWLNRLPSVGQARDGAPGIALRKPPAFLEPHCDIGCDDVGRTPEFIYLRRCEKAGVVPCPAVLRFFDEATGIIDAGRRSLSDADIKAVIDTAVQCASEGHNFQYLDLSDNALTDVGLGRMARLLAGPPAVCTNLRSLRLAGNANLKLQSEGLVNDVARALVSLPQLEAFDMSRVQLQGRAVTRIAAALGDCLALKHLNLSDCGLGRMDQRECVAVAALFEPAKNPRTLEAVGGLETADLAGNYFGRVGFAAVAAALRGSKLRSLSFAHNGGMNMLVGCQGSVKEQESRFHPVQLLVEGMLFNTSLTQIDLCNCGLGPDTAFILEEVLQSHPSLKGLHLQDNPLGDVGIRSILRLVVSIESELHFCRIDGHREADAGAHQISFRYVQPDGSYCLNLKYPHERAILRSLLRRAGKARGAKAGNILRYFKFDARQPKPVLEKDCLQGVLERWVVPTKGTFSFSFLPPLSEAVFQRSQKPSSDELQPEMGVSHSGPVGAKSAAINKRQTRDFDGVAPGGIRENRVVGVRHERSSLFGAAMSGRSQRGSLQPKGVFAFGHQGTLGKSLEEEEEKKPALHVDASEITTIIRDARTQVSALRYPMIRQIFLSNKTVEQQQRFILACSKDLSFNKAQVARLCQDKPELSAKIVVSLFPCIRRRDSGLSLLSSSAMEKVRESVAKQLQKTLWFSEGNMTGRFNLDLANPVDYIVAENCFLVNAWETEVARAQGRPDVSQRGNYEALRNELWNEASFTYSRDWSFPGYGALRFDFSSLRTAPSGQAPMSESVEVVRLLRHSTESGESKLRALRAVSTYTYLSTLQFKSLVNTFSDPEERQEFFCTFFTRVVDMARLLSADVFHSKNIFTATDRAAIIRRIGHLHLLNPLHPENIVYTNNLSIYEERRVVDFLVQLTVKEPGGKVIGSGNNEKYAARGKDGAGKGVLASWAAKGVPTEDVVFTSTYETTTPNQAWRQDLALQYCGLHFAVLEKSTSPSHR